MAETDIQIAYENGYHDGYQLALSELNGKKFEKVTRCKDCKHHLDCDYWIENGDDWYCANGEPEDGDSK